MKKEDLEEMVIEIVRSFLIRNHIIEQPAPANGTSTTEKTGWNKFENTNDDDEEKTYLLMDSRILTLHGLIKKKSGHIGKVQGEKIIKHLANCLRTKKVSNVEILKALNDINKKFTIAAKANVLGFWGNKIKPFPYKTETFHNDLGISNDEISEIQLINFDKQRELNRIGNKMFSGNRVITL